LSFLASFKRSDSKAAAVIEEHITAYVQYYCRSLSHRLLRTPIGERNGISVSLFIKRCKEFVEVLAPGKSFQPTKKLNVYLAEVIDNSSVLRSLFLLFKKVYKKPVYS
jgi:hypothetical protein